MLVVGRLPLIEDRVDGRFDRHTGTEQPRQARAGAEAATATGTHAVVAKSTAAGHLARARFGARRASVAHNHNAINNKARNAGLVLHGIGLITAL